MRRIRRTVAALAAAFLAVLLAPLSAQAVGYQFWGYYQLVDGEWAFAVEGVGTTVPDDGTVQGLRFAVSSGEDVRPPRDVLEFDEVCAEVPAEDGSKRVALVLDPGRDVDSPDGVTPLAPGAQCIVADPGATTLEIVQQAVPDVRTDDADMICGLAGFPPDGCSEEVADPTPEQLAPDDSIEIPVIPVGTPVLAPPTDEPTQEPTTEPTEDPTEPTEDETTEAEETEDPTEPTTDDGTTDDGTTEEDTTQEETETAPAEDEQETQNPPSETPDEADAEDEGSAGIPPWAWAVGILVLLGILAVVATSARNRRLEAAQWEGSDDQPTDDQDWDGR